jgi:hypothetical protein
MKEDRCCLNPPLPTTRSMPRLIAQFHTLLRAFSLDRPGRAETMTAVFSLCCLERVVRAHYACSALHITILAA